MDASSKPYEDVEVDVKEPDLESGGSKSCVLFRIGEWSHGRTAAIGGITLLVTLIGTVAAVVMDFTHVAALGNELYDLEVITTRLSGSMESMIRNATELQNVSQFLQRQVDDLSTKDLRADIDAARTTMTQLKPEVDFVEARLERISPLQKTRILCTGQSVSTPREEPFVSPNGRFELWFKEDANIVLKDKLDNFTLWQSYTHAMYGVESVTLRLDLNSALPSDPPSLNFYDQNGKVIDGYGFQGDCLFLTNNGTLHSYDKGGVDLLSGIPEQHFCVGERLTTGGAICSYDRRYCGVLEADGIFVVYDESGRNVHSTHREKDRVRSQAYGMVQGDGNFCIYGDGFVPLSLKSARSPEVIRKKIVQCTNTVGPENTDNVCLRVSSNGQFQLVRRSEDVVFWPPRPDDNNVPVIIHGEDETNSYLKVDAGGILAADELQASSFYIHPDGDSKLFRIVVKNTGAYLVANPTTVGQPLHFESERREEVEQLWSLHSETAAVGKFCLMAHSSKRFLRFGDQISMQESCTSSEHVAFKGGIYSRSRRLFMKIRNPDHDRFQTVADYFGGDERFAFAKTNNGNFVISTNRNGLLLGVAISQPEMPVSLPVGDSNEGKWYFVRNGKHTCLRSVSLGKELQFDPGPDKVEVAIAETKCLHYEDISVSPIVFLLPCTVGC